MAQDIYYVRCCHFNKIEELKGTIKDAGAKIERQTIKGR